MSNKKKNLLTSLGYICLISVIAFGFITIVATGGGDSNQISADKKYLAKNIVFNNENAVLAKSIQQQGSGIFAFNILPKAYAQSDDIDTETQILAENVIFENSAISQIESDNVQDALEEISLRLPDVIVGTWDIQNYNQENHHVPAGKITIYDNGTFDLMEGSFAAIGMGSGGGDSFCTHAEENQFYQIYTDELISFCFYGANYLPDDEPDCVIPRLVKLREDEIIFIGHGGCGLMGRERISILTRVAE